MRACRPSWCASGHRQPVRRTMNSAPLAVWSSTWPHGVGRRSMGSSISSISFAAASRRPRRSCQRSLTRSDQDRPTPLPASLLRGGRPAVCRLDESIRTWLGHAAGRTVPARSPAPPAGAGGEPQPWRSVKDSIGLAMAEQAGSAGRTLRGDQQASVVCSTKVARLSFLPGGRILPPSRDHSTRPWWSAAARGGGRPRPVGRPGEPGG
jgi:hypothetical protein